MAGSGIKTTTVEYNHRTSWSAAQMNIANTPFLVLLSTMSMMSSVNAFAACEREDIDHYLGKGFTPEQITTICTSGTAASPSASDEASPDQTDTSTLTPEQGHDARITNGSSSISDHELFLIEAVKGRNIKLDDTSLRYTLKVCVEYAEEDIYGFAPKACPQVSYEIKLRGLEILGSGKKYYFYGDTEIRVRGQITRNIIQGLESFTPYIREQIIAVMETGDETLIPIRDDISPDRVQRLLQQLAN